MRLWVKAEIVKYKYSVIFLNLNIKQKEQQQIKAKKNVGLNKQRKSYIIDFEKKLNCQMNSKYTENFNLKKKRGKNLKQKQGNLARYNNTII